MMTTLVEQVEPCTVGVWWFHKECRGNSSQFLPDFPQIVFCTTLKTHFHLCTNQHHKCSILCLLFIVYIGSFLNSIMCYVFIIILYQCDILKNINMDECGQDGNYKTFLLMKTINSKPSFLTKAVVCTQLSSCQKTLCWYKCQVHPTFGICFH